MTIYLKHKYWMSQALELAKVAGKAGEIPVGAVVVDGKNNLIAVGENRRERDKDPTAHAEILALREAGKLLQTWHLNECTLYVTMEPCAMCAGAIVLARIGLLVYGVDNAKSGAIRTVINIPDGPASYHRLQAIGGILESACREELQNWFNENGQRFNPKHNQDQIYCS